MVYKWNSGAHIKASAQDAGELCAALETQGKLTPHEVVEASRPEDAPLHDEFEWDDAKAAERYRETQASYIIRSIEVVISGKTEPTVTRGFVSLVTSDGGREYHEVNKVLSITNQRDMLLIEAKRELAAFKRKYEVLEELADVFAAIDRVG